MPSAFFVSPAGAAAVAAACVSAGLAASVEVDAELPQAASERTMVPAINADKILFLFINTSMS
jgi:hypothetical protein